MLLPCKEDPEPPRDDTEDCSLTKRKYERTQIPELKIYHPNRRVAGSYEFGYTDMNSILREAHNDRVRRTQQRNTEMSEHEAHGIVCFLDSD